MKTSEILNKAADLIEERGWELGDGWYDGTTAPLCLEGGIQAALDFHWQGPSVEQPGEIKTWEEFKRCPAYKAMQEYLDTYGEPDGSELWRWNDNDAEDGEHVIRALRAAALVEAAKEDALVLEEATA